MSFLLSLSFDEGGPPPLDRMIITPRHLSEAEQLEKVLSAGL